MSSPTAPPVAPPGSLPIARARLFGRRHELGAARNLILQEAVPLLTLTGPGGCGKTRFSLAVAHDLHEHFLDGVCFVDLAPLAGPDRVAPAVAQALGLADTPDEYLPEAIIGLLRPQQLLLLLDNCEHLAATVAGLCASLLTACPGLQILATSRSPLHIRGEHAYAVPPLAVPPRGLVDVTDLVRIDAVALFVGRARAAVPDFSLSETNAEAVAEICRRLDGLPLAIELAAAWTRLLPPAALLERLSNNLLELAGGERDMPARQRTMREVIAWSHALLGDDERILFRRLGAFVGGFDLGAAVAVAGDGIEGDIVPRLAALVDQSLVLRSANAGNPRFAMLETIRVYAAERLVESGEIEMVQARHVDWFLALAETGEPHLRGSGQFAWFDRLEQEHPNLRAALRWYQERDDWERALRLAGALGRFWEAHGHIAEGRRLLEELLAATECPSSLPAGTLAKGLSWSGTLAFVQGDFGAARERHRAARDRYEEAGDARGTAFSIGCIAAQEFALGHDSEAERLLRNAEERYGTLGDAWGLGFVSNSLGMIAQQRGDLAAAEKLFEEALAHLRAAGDPDWTAMALSYLGHCARERGDLARAGLLLEEAIALLRAGSTPYWFGAAHYMLAFVAQAKSDHAAAMVLLATSLRICRDLGDRLGLALNFEAMAPSLLALGLPARAIRLLRVADDIRQSLAAPLPPAERTTVERAILAAQEAVGPEAFAAHWTAGGLRPPEHVVFEALSLSVPSRAPGSRLPESLLRESAGRRGDSPGFDLTRREREILGLLCQRLTDLEIADQLYISRSTASKHVANLFSKLGVSNRRAAAALAARHALV